MDIVGMLAPIVAGWPAIIAANVLAIWGVLERLTAGHSALLHTLLPEYYGNEQS